MMTQRISRPSMMQSLIGRSGAVALPIAAVVAMTRVIIAIEYANTVPEKLASHQGTGAHRGFSLEQEAAAGHSVR
jgi:hypothetical protein